MIFILNFLIIISLLILAAMIWRKIPLLVQLPAKTPQEKKDFKQRWEEIRYGGHWIGLIAQLEKFLRRVKILFLRMENLLSQWIQVCRGKSQQIREKSKKWIKIRVKVKEMPETEIEVQPEEIQIEEKEEGNNRLILADLEKPIQEEQKWIDLISQNPKNISAYKELGMLYWKQHNYLDAKASFEVALKLGSKDKKIKELLEEIKKLEA